MIQSAVTSSPETVSIATDVGLVRGRAHEVVGPARAVFALMLAARLTGPILWLLPRWVDDGLMGDGVRAYVEPGRLLFGRARTAPELLWAAEEALRTGLAPLVVVETPVLPSLTPVRRLHLAAEAGAARGPAPLVLLLTPGAGGAAGIESRWRMAPAPGWARDGTPRWRLTRTRARMAPETTWELRFARGVLALERIAEPDAPR